MFNLSSYPQVIIKQATAPTNATAGVLWWDTDDLLLFYYTGSSWIQISSSSATAGLETALVELSLELLRLSAEGVLTAPDYNNMFVDIIADADGQDDTIDTGNTDAVFATDKYVNGAVGVVEDAHSFAISSYPGDSEGRGFKILTKAACSLTKVTKHASVTATKAYLYNSGGTLITSAAFSGDDATFSSSLTDATNYYILVGNDGGGLFTNYRLTGQSFPEVDTNINWIEGGKTDGDPASSSANVHTGTPQAIISIETAIGGTPSDKVVQTNAQALGTAPAYVLIHVKDKTTAGTGSINFDVSFDGGSTWDSTANALDTKIPVVDGSGKSLVLQLNLLGTGAGNTATIEDYEVLLWNS